MSCPICDNKPANCDCSSDAIRLHEENSTLRAKIEELRGALERFNRCDCSKRNGLTLDGHEADCSRLFVNDVLHN